MSINPSIIDQRLEHICKEISTTASNELGISDPRKLKSLAFVYICVKTMLELSHDEVFECLTEGGGDFGIDAMFLTEEIDGEFEVILFQGKYKTDLTGSSHFPENGINSLIGAIGHIFDPSSDLGNINDRLRAKVEEVRSMISDGFLPRVRVIACNNGLKWNDNAQIAIDRANFGDQVTWEHVNHDVLINIQQRTKPVDETLRLSGKAVFEDMNFSRVCIGRIAVIEVASLMRKHGERLLERNIRRYLGLHGNRVNTGIRDTLLADSHANFYFFNNGLTLVCSDFSHNALQGGDYIVKVENLQIVNGAQTCMTIFKTLEKMESDGRPLPKDASVLVRIYKLPKENEDIVLQITQATNSQNPVDLKDLRSNDEKQKRLEANIKDLGYVYRRQRMEGQTRTTDITSGTAAEAILAVWCDAPHQAKFFTREHFGKLYNIIFSDLRNGAQVILAVLLYRIAENRRRRPDASDPMFVRYASCFIAMQMGRYLLKDMKSEDMSVKDMNISVPQLDHRNFAEARELIESNGKLYFDQSKDDIENALIALYGKQDISMQQLSATFRRGDLIGLLPRP